MQDPAPGRRSFPLSALFMLMAASGVVAALMTPMARSVVAGNVGTVETAFASVLGGFIVMLLGGIVGLYHYRRTRGLLWGLLTGAGIGLILGPVSLSPTAAFPSLLTMSVGGAVVLIVISVVFRASARPRDAA